MALAAAMAMSASAAEANQINQDSDPQQGSSTVTYSVDPSYTVTIPTSVTLLDSADVPDSVSASDVRLEKGKKIVVSLADSNDFKVKNGDESITYQVSNTAGVLAAGDTVKEFTENGSEELTFAQIDKDTVQYAGTYTGSLTFNIAVEDTALPVPDMITITNSAYSGTANFTTTDGIVNVSFTNPSGNTFRNDGDGDGWFFYGANSTTTVTAAEGYTIDKVKFYTKAENGTGVAEVTSAPFTVYSGSGYHTYTGPNNTGTDLGAWGVNKIEVYFK